VEPLTYRQAEELIGQQGEFAEFVLPPEQVLEFAVRNHVANQVHRRNHVPDVFDGDVIIFSATRGADDQNDLCHPEDWRPVKAAHDETLRAEPPSSFFGGGSDAFAVSVWVSPHRGATYGLGIILRSMETSSSLRRQGVSERHPVRVISSDGGIHDYACAPCGEIVGVGAAADGRSSTRGRCRCKKCVDPDQ